MSASNAESTRIRILAVLLLLAALWPGVHHGLARSLHFDPWELFGWAMYSVPHPRVQVAIEEQRGGEWSFLRTGGEERSRVRAYARRRTLLGELAPPEPLARFLLQADPEREALRVTLKRWRLDRDSARWVTEDRVIPFPRSPGAASH